jgi:hypothetical protein
MQNRRELASRLQYLLSRYSDELDRLTREIRPKIAAIQSELRKLDEAERATTIAFSVPFSRGSSPGI